MTRDEICTKFLESIPVDLYPYQEEALLSWFEESGGVMVCAPTGMGKTLIAEAAVFEALHTRQRLYYTTPLIALTDQKFRELRDQAEKWGFSRDDVGLITGNRKVNPDALVRVVVAEILLNHLLSEAPGTGAPAEAGALAAAPGATGEPAMSDVSAVVMDEFHSFNDYERGIVWELSLVLLPAHVRVLLLSATVGNPYEFARWLRVEHGRDVKLVQSEERRVPLEFNWVGDKLITELLPSMVSANDEDSRVPALVFCFNRDECWDVAERLKGLPIISNAQKTEIEKHLAEYQDDLADGVGPKLKQMLIRGVGVHHAGVLPKHKEIVETLFGRKLVPFVVCTETLAAGINLPARSVVLSTLMKGKHGEKKLVAPSVAHQIFGRAGRPQFDKKGYMFALAHEDDVRLHKWKLKYDQIPANTKDPGLLRARKDLERKKPRRSKTEQYWTEGQLGTLIKAGPAKLQSRSMIPYNVLIYMLTRTGTLDEVRSFISKRFESPGRLQAFREQLDFMLNNMASLGYLTRSDDGEHVTLSEGIHKLLTFRSIDPLYGAFLVEQLAYASTEEKILALESVLELPPAIIRRVRIPDLTPGPLETEVLKPLLVQMGAIVARPQGDGQEDEYDGDDYVNDWAEEEERPPTFPEMLKMVFESRLAAPEPVRVQPKWVAGGVAEAAGEFYKFVRSRELVKQEGLILRHLLRLVILAGEFATLTEDPDYQRISELATSACQQVDPRYTSRFLEQAEEVKKLAPA